MIAAVFTYIQIFRKYLLFSAVMTFRTLYKQIFRNFSTLFGLFAPPVQKAETLPTRLFL